MPCYQADASLKLNLEHMEKKVFTLVVDRLSRPLSPDRDPIVGIFRGIELVNLTVAVIPDQVPTPGSLVTVRPVSEVFRTARSRMP